MTYLANHVLKALVYPELELLEFDLLLTLFSPFRDLPSVIKNFVEKLITNE